MRSRSPSRWRGGLGWSPLPSKWASQFQNTKGRVLRWLKETVDRLVEDAASDKLSARGDVQDGGLLTRRFDHGCWQILSFYGNAQV